MSLVNAARNQIKKYGFKGAAHLTPLISKTDDFVNQTVTPLFGPKVALSSYVGSYSSDEINNTTVFINDRKILAVPDADWDGTLLAGSIITIDGIDYDMLRFTPYRIKQTIAYVVIQVRG